MVRRKMSIAPIGRWLLELAFPLYGLTSTPELRRYWRDLPLGRAWKLFLATFLVLSAPAFLWDLLATDSFHLSVLILVAVGLGGIAVLIIFAALQRPTLVPILTTAISGIYLAMLRLPAMHQVAADRHTRGHF
jgi:hypothetical protein